MIETVLFLLLSVDIGGNEIDVEDVLPESACTLRASILNHYTMNKVFWCEPGGEEHPDKGKAAKLFVQIMAGKK